MSIEIVGLCHRCEYRAQFLESGHGPRCECQGTGAVCGCYMYTPVRPVIQERRTGDRRPVSAPAMIRARMTGTRVAVKNEDVVLVLTQAGTRKRKPQYLSSWIPVAVARKLYEEVEPKSKDGVNH